MDPIQTGLHAFLAAVLTAVLALLAEPARRRLAGVPVPLLGIALVGAALWQFGVQEGTPRWPYGDPAVPRWHSLAWTLLGSLGAASLAAPLLRTSAPGQRFAIAVASSAVVLALLRTSPVAGREPAHIAALLALALSPAWSLAAERLPTRAMLTSIVLAFVVLTAMALEVAHFAKLTAIAGTLAGASIAALVVSLRFRVTVTPLVAAVVLILVGSMCVVAAPYARETPGWIWILPSTIPLTALAAELPWLRRRPRLAPALRYLLPALAALGILAAALGPSLLAGSDDASDDSSAYG